VPTPRKLAGVLSKTASGPDQALYFSAPPESETAAAIDRIVRSVSGIRRRTGALVCLVTSAEAYQGKSTIALNLALAFARSGDRVVLVDADHHSGVATAAGGKSSALGLAEVVGGTATCEECVVERSEPPVALLPTGDLAGANLPRESMSRLGRTLIAPLSHFDAIVVDASANPRDRLTLALAAHADVCLLVAQEGNASKAALEDGARWLETTMSGELHVVTIALG
jgi:tyrosine-protein kinase Etk/Wzc